MFVGCLSNLIKRKTPEKEKGAKNFVSFSFLHFWPNLVVSFSRRMQRSPAVFRSFPSIVHFVIIAISLAGTNVTHAADQEEAFVLQGTFEDVFSGRQVNSGTFTVNAFGEMALIDMVYDHDFHQLVGTDGEDSYVYSRSSSSPGGVAAITKGRFPKEGHFLAQLLWLASTRDNVLVEKLPSMKFPFFNHYEIVTKVASVSGSTGGLASVEWLVPGQFVSGTNRYSFALYPDGWLRARLDVPERMQISKHGSAPRKIVVAVNATHSVTNPQAPPEAYAPRTPEDVIIIQRVVFSVTNAYASKHLATYMPTVLDKNAQVTDKRSKRPWVGRTESGRWWNVGKSSSAYEAPASSQGRLFVVTGLALTSIIFAAFLIRGANDRRSSDHINKSEGKGK